MTAQLEGLEGLEEIPREFQGFIRCPAPTTLCKKKSQTMPLFLNEFQLGYFHVLHSESCLAQKTTRKQ